MARMSARMFRATIYGIPNCDTMKKACAWLRANDVSFHFHDFRKDGLDASQVEQWAADAGWETLLNRRGLTWRKLPESDKSNLDEAKAVRLMAGNPTLIKRPVLVRDDSVLVGFSESSYRVFF